MDFALSFNYSLLWQICSKGKVLGFGAYLHAPFASISPSIKAEKSSSAQPSRDSSGNPFL
jgi:hypothetical protein